MSTSHALIDLVEEITSSIDANKISIGVFIDLKKAFDTVNHTLLIDKLEYYGIRGIAQEWLKSYLKDRKQFVQIDECASTLYPRHTGGAVPLRCLYGINRSGTAIVAVVPQ